MSLWHWLLIGLVAVGIVPALWLLDRLGLWLEERGLLFYRKKRPSGSPLSGLVGFQQMIEPGVRHVVGVGRQRRAEHDDREARDRLLAWLREALRAETVIPEAVRLYLTQARKEGLDWKELYAEAAKGLPEHRAPAVDDVTPLD